MNALLSSSVLHAGPRVTQHGWSPSLGGVGPSTNRRSTPQTLPAISWSPKPLAGWEPTGEGDP